MAFRGPSSQTETSAGGFSIIELLVVISVLGLLSALAIPGFRDLMARYQTSTVANEIVGVLTSARMESIRRGGSVVIQKKTTGTNSCSTNQEWSCGLILWTDTNHNGILDVGEQLKELDIPARVVVRNMSGSSPSSMTFNRWGNANGINALHFRLIRSGVSTADRSVCVTSGGRIRIESGIDCP